MKIATAALALALVAGFGANAMANETTMAPTGAPAAPAVETKAEKDFMGVDCKTLKGHEMKACEKAHKEAEHTGKNEHKKTM